MLSILYSSWSKADIKSESISSGMPTLEKSITNSFATFSASVLESAIASG